MPPAARGRGIAPVLLAAGTSSRFEGGHKLLAPLDLGDGPRPVVAHVFAALVEAFETPPLVVLGARAAEIEAALGAPARTIRNPDHARGMGTSLAVAARALLADGGPAPPVLLALGDMPLVNAATHRAVAGALGPAPDAAARATTAGTPRPRPGHPVALGPAWLERLAALDGDEGLRDALGGATVARVPVDARTQIDVDTRDALARAASRS